MKAPVKNSFKIMSERKHIGHRHIDEQTNLQSDQPILAKQYAASFLKGGIINTDNAHNNSL